MGIFHGEGSEKDSSKSHAHGGCREQEAASISGASVRRTATLPLCFGPLWIPQVQGDIRVIIRKTSRLFEKAASEDRKGDGVPRVGSISPPRSGGRAFSRYYSSTVGRQQQQMIQKSRKAVESSHAVTNGGGGAVKRKGGMSNRRTVLFACVRCLVARTEPQLPGPANSMRRFSAMTHPPGGIATFIDMC